LQLSEVDRSRIGWKTQASVVAIDAWRVRLFCQAIGENNPVYWETSAAQAAGFARCPLPPTFLKSMEAEHCSNVVMLKVLNAPLARVLHADQVFEHHHPVYAGDRVQVQREVMGIEDRKGGALTFIHIDTTYRITSNAQDGELVAGALAATSRQSIVVRNTVAAA
jgi:acyl dehydratase